MPIFDLLRQGWDSLGSVPHLRLYLTAGWALYLLLLGGWIVLQKREPAATLSWLFSLALLPYVGFLIYYIFGPQRIRRQRLRRQQRHVRVEELLNDDAEEVAEISRLSAALTGLLPSTAREVQLLIDGAAKYDALLADLAQAERQVHLEYYIYTPDRIGTALRDALTACARRGVKVRLLLDAVGAKFITAHWLRPLTDAGAEVAWFHPAQWGQFWKRPWLNLRTHRKIVVIDGRIAYTGGMNITDEQDPRVDPQKAYRDLHLRLTGDIVRSLQLVFVEDWAYATGDHTFIGEVARIMPPPAPGPIRAQSVSSGPDSPWEAIYRVHVSAIHAASQRVWLMTPYFVPGEAGMMALTSAAKAGLDVRLLVPKWSDSRLVTYAARSYFGRLMEAGVKVYEYGPRMLHSKALLVDEDVVILGSANFDHRSFRLNFELSVLFHDAGIGAQLAAHITSELASAPRLHLAAKRPLRQRLPEAFARLLSPLL